MPYFAKIFLALAAVNGLLAVVLGAFGAHGLKGKLSEKMLSAWEVGVQYQFYHAFALALVGVLINQGLQGRLINSSGVLFAVGILFFSGSLYGLALGGPRILGPITPLGGMCFIIAWGVLLASIVKS